MRTRRNLFTGFGFALLAIILSFLVVTVYLGVRYRNHCPMEEWIPIFMTVTGISGLFVILIWVSIIGSEVLFDHLHPYILTALTMLRVGLVAFNLCWNIAGSYWIFKQWHRWDSISDVTGTRGSGCDKDMYLAGLSYLILYWLLSPLLCVCAFGDLVQKYVVTTGRTYPVEDDSHNEVSS